MPVFNIIISVLLIAAFLIFFLPVKVAVNRVTASLVLLLATVGVLVYTAGLTEILYLMLSAFCLWAFIFGFLVNRKYPYILAAVLLIFCPFLLIAKLDQIAEFSAVLAYLCLVLGVLKDIFYDKVVDGGGND